MECFMLQPNPWKSLVFLFICWQTPMVSADFDRTSLPILPTQYQGTLAATEQDSTAQYQTTVKAPDGAPNVIIIMSDDAGFASTSTFGGSIPTPNLDKLASKGLRYNRFHTTGICSPTRAALFTGRNHHRAGMGMLVDVPSPYRGYNGRIEPSTATIARILRDNGYNTAMLGKDHNIPQAERSPSGPFDQWPTGRGFEYFYGFIAGDSDQFQPSLYEGISKVVEADRPDDYMLDKDLADKAIQWIHNQKASDPDKPFFLYIATGSPHAPNQAPQAWLDKFKGKYDHGWDVERERILANQIDKGLVPKNTQLTERPDIVPAWSSLSDKEQAVYARFMEVIAAQIAYQDAQMGRVFDEIERMGIDQNTLVLYIEGDNGASAEGGITGAVNEMAEISTGTHLVDVDIISQNLDKLGGRDVYQGPPAGWTMAMNTPFPWFKQMPSHLGGMRNGLIVSWPQQITEKGGVRQQFHHVIDILPTVLDAANIPQPSSVDGVIQDPIDGLSMLYSFNQPTAEDQRKTQYFEVLANRGIYHEGWFANTSPRNMPWKMPVQKNTDIKTYTWELYDLNNDFSQSRNLAQAMPEKLAELQAVFAQEAIANDVYPIHDTGARYRAIKRIKASRNFRSKYEFWGRDIFLQSASAPPLMSMSFSLVADIEVDAAANGVIVAAGSHFGGWSFYLNDGYPMAFASVTPMPIEDNQTRIKSDVAIGPGKHTIEYSFDYGHEDGTLSILIDGQLVKEQFIKRAAHIIAGNGETFDIGRDTNVPVTSDYHNEGVFDGVINKVTVLMKPKMASH
jgi:arylsulfatase A-like enzyme